MSPPPALGRAPGHVTQRRSEQPKTLLDARARICDHLRHTENQHDADHGVASGCVPWEPKDARGAGSFPARLPRYGGR
ncbi:hypothetical protein ACWC4C_31985 [Streptomyces olivaceoviridis]